MHEDIQFIVLAFMVILGFVNGLLARIIFRRKFKPVILLIGLCSFVEISAAEVAVGLISGSNLSDFTLKNTIIGAIWLSPFIVFHIVFSLGGVFCGSILLRLKRDKCSTYSASVQSKNCNSASARVPEPEGGDKNEGAGNGPTDDRR